MLGVNGSFDFLVVGGGTAGLTLATRLAQNGSFSVAVVEAGGMQRAIRTRIVNTALIATLKASTNSRAAIPLRFRLWYLETRMGRARSRE